MQSLHCKLTLIGNEADAAAALASAAAFDLAARAAIQADVDQNENRSHHAAIAAVQADVDG
jgi:hypothetical protein